MKTEQITDLYEKYVMNTYRRFPLALVRGEGARVWDAEGREYLDMTAGIAVCSLGHAHPGVAAAIARQAETLVHVSNLYYTELQARFAQKLVENSFADKVFFCNSGAEANEAAIKLARKYGHEQLGGRYELITMRDSFHGRTLATITATGQEKFQVGFAPLPEGFKYAPFDDLAALDAAISEKTCGVLLEPIQGEGGVRIPHEGYLRGVREICDRRGILMMLDEVQVGMGRTGNLFAYEDSGISPDIMTLAKAMGNGFPVGAMLTTDRVAAAFQPGNHASTFGGTPLAMAACMAVFEAIRSEGLLVRCRQVGAYFLERLRFLAASCPSIVEVRGKGLIIGMELNRDGAGVVAQCREKGLLIITSGAGNVLRFVPPLIITEKDVDSAVSVLEEVFNKP
jgi:acetylornithine aminotransferase/acetylornithine/N-succinyldiaminopimelate aminotransferase